MDIKKENEIYDKDYYDNYDIGVDHVSYKESEIIANHLGFVADKIIETINPKTVLDVGCAMGFLVKALRDRGVEAYGIDISEYAISQVDDSVKPFCRAVSSTETLPKDFPQHFDLVFNCEVIEHINETDALLSVKNICSYADKVLFSSTPDGYEEETHINVQKNFYWAKAFAENGFLNNLESDPTFLTKHALLFEKKSMDTANLVEAYEKNIFKATGSIDSLNNQIKEATLLKLKSDNDVNTLNSQIKKLEANAKILESGSKKLKLQLLNLTNTHALVANEYNSIVSSFWWKVTKPFRFVGTRTKMFLRSNPVTRLPYKVLMNLKSCGLRMTSRKIHNSMSKNNNKNYKYIAPTKEELDMQKNTKFDKNIKFSILVPLYNTPEKYLRAMIESVIAQSYSNWELCLADGSDDKHGFVGEICGQYAYSNDKIKYKKLEKNLGISGNTNACIEMSTGNYIALFDHDDLLDPSVLYYNMIEIENKNADFIYTDEAVFAEVPEDAYGPHFKPDFAIDNLRAHNYICHFSVFSRELLDQIGLFRDKCHGSQDYDIILRLTEKAKSISHIPKILYFWRCHENSVASDISAKPYVIDAAHIALNDHFERVGLEATVHNNAHILSVYDIEYKIKDNPLVSILIPNKDHIDVLNTCIQSIVEKSTYPNYEIVIVENNSEEEKTFEYYKDVVNIENVKITYYEGDFNYSKINNFGYKHCNGEHILLLNNDIEIITPDWIEQMLMYSQREDVGAVGALLLYPDGSVQHGGVLIGAGGAAGHYHKDFDGDSLGYMGRLIYTQNVSAVTAACLMLKKSVFEEVGMFDESFKVAYNDVDLCLKLRQAGYLNIFTPLAKAYHHESKSRGLDNSGEKLERFLGEYDRLRIKWHTIITEGDPYYNENLTLDREDLSLK